MIKKRIIIHKGVWREKIINVIAEHPGIYFRQIQKALKTIPLGALTRHLHTLEKQGKIISKKHRQFDYKCFWAKEQYSYQHPMILHKLTPTQSEIYDIIKNKPGIVPKEIVFKTKKARRTVMRHLNSDQDI